MRDALFELLKSTTENKLECLMNARDVSTQLAMTRDPKEVVKVLSRCLLGIEIDTDQAGAMFTIAWTDTTKLYRSLRSGTGYRIYYHDRVASSDQAGSIWEVANFVEKCKDSIVEKACYGTGVASS